MSRSTCHFMRMLLLLACQCCSIRLVRKQIYIICIQNNRTTDRNKKTKPSQSKLAIVTHTNVSRQFRNDDLSTQVWCCCCCGWFSLFVRSFFLFFVLPLSQYTNNNAGFTPASTDSWFQAIYECVRSNIRLSFEKNSIGVEIQMLHVQPTCSFGPCPTALSKIPKRYLEYIYFSSRRFNVSLLWNSNRSLLFTLRHSFLRVCNVYLYIQTIFCTHFILCIAWVYWFHISSFYPLLYVWVCILSCLHCFFFRLLLHFTWLFVCCCFFVNSRITN